MSAAEFMSDLTKADIRAIIKALYVQRNRFGRLDGDGQSRNELTRVVRAGRYKLPHGGSDTVDQAMMVLQCMIGDEPTSILDAQVQPDGSLKPRERKPLTMEQKKQDTKQRKQAGYYDEYGED